MIVLLLLTAALLTCAPVPARGQGQVVGNLFQKVFPSVVTITAQATQVTSREGTVRITETGTGVLVTKDGRIMTAAHVVHAFDEISVTFPTGDTVPARVIGSEPAADLALIKVDQVPEGARIARMADSSKVRVGDQVIIVGAPYGLQFSLSVGYISARHAPNTVYRAFPLAEFLQTDAAINTGNSGGPMFNMAGQVIGIVSHVISKGGGSEGLGFVVSINTARELLLRRKAFWSGMEFYHLTGGIAAALNLPQPAGMLVKSVAKGSPGEAAGLRAGTLSATLGGNEMILGGDVVLEVAGILIDEDPATLGKIRQHLNELKSGETYSAKILRAGTIAEVTGQVP
jgi:S1-C subfamily serine protease